MSSALGRGLGGRLHSGALLLRGGSSGFSAPPPVTVLTSRSFIFKHERVGKFEVPELDSDGKKIPRAPNGFVTRFELYTQGALTEENQDAYYWGMGSSRKWRLLFFGNFCLGMWLAYFWLNNFEHLFCLDRLQRRKIVAELSEKERKIAAEEAESFPE